MSDDPSIGKQIQKSYFIALVKEQAANRSEVAEINGDFGERLKAAQDNSNLNLKAFRVVCQMAKMEEQKRNAFWDCLELYHDFAQEELWGGQHVGDLDKMARAASERDDDEREPLDVTIRLENGDEVVTTGSAAAAMDESVRNAQGIGELPAEQHAENQKPRRRGPKAKVADVGEDPVDVAAERGRVAWLNREPGRIPADLEGKPKESKAWLDAWEAGQVEASKARDAENFDRNPPRGSALPGADAPGSYTLAH